jgi:hypothetical protein
MRKIILLTVLALLLVHSPAHSGSVDGYYRKDGTYVGPYQRTNPDHNPYNNYNFPGNYNPNSGRTTPGNPDTYVDRYNDRGRSSGGLGGYNSFDYRRR